MVELLIIIYNNCVMTLDFSIGEHKARNVSPRWEDTAVQLGFLSSENNWSKNKVVLLSRKYTPEPQH